MKKMDRDSDQNNMTKELRLLNRQKSIEKQRQLCIDLETSLKEDAKMQERIRSILAQLSTFVPK
jgi:hypothetical protein